jgi:hypothetical protein
LEDALPQLANSAVPAEGLFIQPSELSDVMRWHHPHSAWNAAALSTRQVDPFCCLTYWQLSFHEAFNPHRRLLIKESSGNVIAFAEKVFSEDSVFITPIEPHWLFGTPLLGPDSVDLLSDTIGDIEYFYGSNFPTIVISGIAPNGVLYQKLQKQFSSKFEFSHHSSGLQCAASLAGGLDGFLSRRSSNLRRNLKKKTKLAANSGISFERFSPSTELEAERIYSRMISVELASWKGTGRCGMAEPPARQYYEIMLKRLALSKNARIILAQHDGNDIGFIFGGMAGKTIVDNSLAMTINGVMLLLETSYNMNK